MTGIAGGLVLLLVAGITVFAVYGPRTTRLTDAAVLVEELEADGRMNPFVSVFTAEGGETVVSVSEYVEDSGYLDSADMDLEGVALDAFRLAWEELPGSFDIVSVTVFSDFGISVETMGRDELQEEFGPRPSGLDSAPVEHDGSEPTENTPGECADDYCDKPSLTIGSPQTLELIRRTCTDLEEGLAGLTSLPTPSSNQQETLSGDQVWLSSVGFRFGDPEEPDWVNVTHIGDSAEFLEISCGRGDAAPSEDIQTRMFTRTQYENAA
ncbi:tumor necrosis factor receptor superfamily protein 12A [Spinactinospora alkalitolerans]|uniref:Tumor necrosis factor receptor superfamily protein 12A n=1 Tax=Spinactinospora alkalitolerans TaxID=687207 RepID=A0A852TXC9_9ACTN|nr:hypothetical protein [Spinactinospora alkalitolerans]NYE47572.1 tumor necrosis factor receptor superfamily protein 12A [Spinactinospora alkalitolerans]